MNVIIPTFNRPAMLRELLTALESQTVRASVIVTDDGSADPLSPADWPSVRKYLWTRNTGFGIAARLNEALAACGDDPTAVIADDCLPIGRDWLEKMERALVVAPFAVGPIQYHPEGVADYLGFSLANFACDPVAWRFVGGLDEAFCGSYGYEEADFGMRIAERGLTIALVDDAPVLHRGAPYADGDRGPAVMGRNRALFEQKWGHVK